MATRGLTPGLPGLDAWLPGPAHAALALLLQPFPALGMSCEGIVTDVRTKREQVFTGVWFTAEKNFQKPKKSVLTQRGLVKKTNAR